MKQKKILLLGGSAAQIIAIEKAKELGYYTVLCDFLPDNPGQYIADKFYLVSTTDKETVLSIAKDENIDGIVAYSSDPAAPTAAFVANAMGLVGMDYDIVRCFCEKQLFREYLQKNDFNIPQSLKIDVSSEYVQVNTSILNFPLIVKPTDSSGSKGITVLQDIEQLQKAIEYARQYSRNKILIVEEFITRDHPHVIEAEIFAIDGKVVSWGLINSIRDKESNPLLPSAYTYPLDLSETRKQIVRDEISRLISSTGKTSGAFNIEMIIDKNDRLYFLDAGPRNGGNMLPEFISMISEKDMVEATIKIAMGEPLDYDISLDGENGGYWGLGVLHTSKSGFYNGMEYSSLAKKSLVREVIQKKLGDEVRPFERCNDLVGLNFYHFTTQSEMQDTMYFMHKTMKVKLQ